MPNHVGVRLMGDFRLDGLDLSTLRSRQARTVLKVLAMARGTPVSTDRLIDAVWADQLPTDPERHLAVLVSRIRSTVGAERLERSAGGYRFVADWFDRAELEELTQQASARLATGDVAAARAAAESALGLVRGPLLADEPDAPWCVTARDEAAAIAAEARAVAAAAALATGRPFEAQLHARAALEHDPYDEAAVRTLMRAHVVAGRPASALHEFATLRARLRDELGVDPTPETAQLHAVVVRGETEATPGALAPTLVGRHDELARLDASLTRSRSGLVVVDLTGEIGIGKSVLVRAWAARARAAGATVLIGTAVVDGTEVGLQAVTDAIGSVAPLGSDGGDPHGPPGRAATPDALRQARFAALDDAMGTIAARVPTAIVIDDAHHADGLTMAWLAHLRRHRGEHRFLVVACHPSEAELGLGGSVDTLVLGPLTERDAADLVGPKHATLLWTRTGGNPLLLTELANSTNADGETGGVPATIRDAVGVRLRRAGPSAPTIAAAAVLDMTVDVDLLAAVLGIPALTVLEHVDDGLRLSFLADRDGALVFRHEVVREVIAEGTAAARRAWLHREAARALAATADCDPLLVARHARLGGERRLAAAALADAASDAAGRLDLGGAEAMLTDALGLDEAPDLHLRRARVRLGRADFDGADSDADAALAAGARAAALEVKAWSARHRHDMDSAIRLGRAGAAAAIDPATRASCLVAVAFAQRGLGDLRGADETLAAATDGGPGLDLDAWVGVLRVHQGRAGEALDALLPHVGAEGGALLSFWVEHVLQMTAHAYGLIGRIGDALALVDRLERELDRRGSVVRYGGVANTYRSWLLRSLGAPSAEAQARVAIEHPGSPEILAQATLDLADTLVGLGHVDAAASTLEQARTAMEVRWFHNRWRAEQRAGLIASRVASAGGDWAAATDTAEAVAAAARERGDERYSTIATLLAARAGGRVGQPIDPVRTDRALLRLDQVAAPEGWWLAADLAADTGSRLAHSVAERLGVFVASEAGPHAEAFRAVLARRLT